MDMSSICSLGHFIVVLYSFCIIIGLGDVNIVCVMNKLPPLPMEFLFVGVDGNVKFIKNFITENINYFNI